MFVQLLYTYYLYIHICTYYLLIIIKITNIAGNLVLLQNQEKLLKKETEDTDYRVEGLEEWISMDNRIMEEKTAFVSDIYI